MNKKILGFLFDRSIFPILTSICYIGGTYLYFVKNEFELNGFSLYFTICSILIFPYVIFRFYHVFLLSIDLLRGLKTVIVTGQVKSVNDWNYTLKYKKQWYELVIIEDKKTRKYICFEERISEIEKGIHYTFKVTKFSGIVMEAKKGKNKELGTGSLSPGQNQ